MGSLKEQNYDFYRTPNAVAVESVNNMFWSSKPCVPTYSEAEGCPQGRHYPSASLTGRPKHALNYLVLAQFLIP